MRKKLALLLVLALIVTMLPMSAFAASKNTVSKVVKVKDDAELNGKDVPTLKIKNDNSDFTSTERFRVQLETAKWLDTGDETTADTVYKDANGEITDFEDFMAEQIKKASYANNGDPGSLIMKVEVRRASDSRIEVNIIDGVFSKDEHIVIPLFVEMDGKGDAKATIEPMDSNLGGGTYTFAIGAGGDTITTIDDVESFADPKTIKTIQIDEAAVGAIERGTDRKVKIKLPTNFKWKSGEGKVTFGGSFAGKGVVTIKKPATNNKTNKVAIDNIDEDCFVDNRTIEFYIEISKGAPQTRGTIYISDLVIDADKNAKTGEVKATISGDDITTEDIVVAKYVDYDITIEAKDDPRELLAGRYDDVTRYSDAKRNNMDNAGDYPKTDSDEHKLTKLKIEEEVANSWLTSRKTRVEFPTWVKILNVKVTDSDKFDKSSQDIENEINEQLDVEDNYIEFSLDKDPKASDTDKLMLELEFYVSIEAGKEGDIEAVVGGKALDQEQTVVLGKAINPVGVETKSVDIRTGIKNQALNKITITENKAEALIKDGDLALVLEEGVKWTEVPDIEVVEGDLDLDIDGAKIDKTDNNDDTLLIRVKGDSSKASVIEITNAKIDLTRYVAEGTVEMKVTGDAVVENSRDLNEIELKLGAFKEENAAKVAVAKVVTPADANVGAGKEVVFTIGESKYTVDGVEQAMDTAAYIKDGRTMLPVRYVAEALGVHEDNIIWNNATRTVTILKGERTVFITIGSAELKVNGTPLYMDTVAEIKDGRTMLPISFIGKALGAQVDWDASARTVTIK